MTGMQLFFGFFAVFFAIAAVSDTSQVSINSTKISITAMLLMVILKIFMR